MLGMLTSSMCVSLCACGVCDVYDTSLPTFPPLPWCSKLMVVAVLVSFATFPVALRINLMLGVMIVALAVQVRVLLAVHTPAT